jgi:hypothetical protein
MTDLTNVQFNHTFLATLSLTIHIKNISTIQVYYIHYYVTHGFFQRNKITIELVASNQGKKTRSCGGGSNASRCLSTRKVRVTRTKQNESSGIHLSGCGYKNNSVKNVKLVTFWVAGVGQP